MKEAEITRFLATEVMQWNMFGESDMGWWENKNGSVSGYHWTRESAKFHEGEYFNPIHNIAHAFMVEDAIFAKGGWDSCEESQWIEKRKHYVHRLEDQIKYSVHRKGYHPSYRAMFDLVHSSPKQRSIAAVRALATDEQIGEWL